MNTLKPSEILRAGLNLLETKGWTQHDYAKDANGDGTNRPEWATCFCGIGAIRAAAFNDLFVPAQSYAMPSYRTARWLLDTVLKLPTTSTTCWASWQDKPNRTFAEVKAKFLEAIELAEQQEQNIA